MRDGRRSEKCFQNFQQIFNIPPVIDGWKQEKGMKKVESNGTWLSCVFNWNLFICFVALFSVLSGVLAWRESGWWKGFQNMAEKGRKSSNFKNSKEWSVEIRGHERDSFWTDFFLIIISIDHLLNKTTFFSSREIPKYFFLVFFSHFFLSVVVQSF